MVEIMTVEDIAGWDEDLQALTDGLGWLFNRPEPRVTFGLMVRGLLADVAKKNSWGLAEHLGLATPQPLEHLLGGARWGGCHGIRGISVTIPSDVMPQYRQVRCCGRWWGGRVGVARPRVGASACSP